MRSASQLFFIRVARVLAEVIVLRFLHRAQGRRGVSAANTKLVRAPHRNGDGGEYRQHHGRGERFLDRELADHGEGSLCQDTRTSSPSRWQ